MRAAGDARSLGLYGFGAAAHIVAQVARHEQRRVLAFTRTRHRATVLTDGRILFTGGSNLDWRLPELKTAEVYSTD